MNDPRFEHLSRTPSTEAELQQLIDDKVEESLQLDYKRAASLGGTNRQKKEITKDVSAMANADGGRIIYGIAEADEGDGAPLPEQLDPVDRRDFTEERLDQVIGNIRPRLEVRITTVPISTGEDDVVYVVDIPKGTTAHQAQDKRYYKRFNFRAEPMDDYEVRDVMGRVKHPQLDLRVGIRKELVEPSILESIGGQSRKPKTVHRLEATAFNEGTVVARHVVVRLYLPRAIVSPNELFDDEGGDEWIGRVLRNSVRDLVGFTHDIGGRIPHYGPARYVPILPNLSQELNEAVELHPDLPMLLARQDFTIHWSLHADEARPVEEEQELTLEFYKEHVAD